MREVSHIHTAPASRLPVATAILPWDPSEVQAALRQELQRGGQAFYVVPRIRDIPLPVEMLTELLKGARRDGADPGIVVAHGGLPPGQAEEVLVRFAMRGPRGGDVLVATTLIENGITENGRIQLGHGQKGRSSNTARKIFDFAYVKL